MLVVIQFWSTKDESIMHVIVGKLGIRNWKYIKWLCCERQSDSVIPTVYNQTFDSILV